MNFIRSEIDDNILIQKIIWINSSIILFLLTKLFPEKEDYSTKYSQWKKKSIIHNTIKVIHGK